MIKSRNNKSELKALIGKKISVLGYGSQGRAQALNLSDSGFRPIIGLPSKSKSRKIAKSDKFEITTPANAVNKTDIVVILIPDHKHKELFDSLDMKLLNNKTIVFAHGFSVAFGLIEPPPFCDTILIAPHGPGVRIREKYIAGETFTAFVGIENNYSGNADQIVKAYATAIGCPQSGQFETNFRDEAVGDVFGEQAVLCGGLVGLLESGFETLVKKGLSPETAYLECIYQIDLIVDLIKKFGPGGMFERISVTAAYGSLKQKDKLFDSNYKKKLDKLYGEIDSGIFAKKLLNEYKNGMGDFKKLISENNQSGFQKAHEQLLTRLKSDSQKPGRRTHGAVRKKKNS